MIGDEGDIFEKCCEILRIEHPIVSSRHTEEFFYILDLAFVFILGVLSLEVFEVPCPLDHILPELRHSDRLSKLSEHLVGETKALNSLRANSREGGKEEIIFRKICEMEVFTCEYFEKIFEGLLSDLAAWNIDDALQTHRIIRVEDEAHIGENVLYLLSLIELHSTKNPIRNIFSDEGLFDEPRLTIGAIEDCPVRI